MCIPFAFGLRLPLLPPPPAPAPLAPVVPPFDIVVDVKGSGKGEGSSSTERECGLRKGPVVIGRLLISPLPAPAPFGRADPGAPSGVGGGDVPSLLRNLRVMCGRVVESSAASITKGTGWVG